MHKPLISATELQVLLNDDNTLLIDLSSKEHYDNAHIPGAIHLAPSLLSSGEKPASGKLPSKEKLETLFQHIGLTENSHVICYDDSGFSWAGRFIWTLDIIGHTKASIINGGLTAWINTGYTASNNKMPNTTSNYRIKQWNTDVIAEKEEILSGLNEQYQQIWDARSKAEYSGEKVLAERGGHIPGATHLEWTELHDQDGNIKETEELRLTLERYGIEKNNTIITHCQTHRRSGLTYFVAKKLLGYNIKAYPGSWSEWGNDTHLPIEN